MAEINILDTLYNARLEKISTLDKKDIGMLENATVRIAEYEAELDECFIKIEDKNLKSEIRILIEERINIENDISSYIKEKFYKARLWRCKTITKIAQKSVLFFLLLSVAFF